MQLAVGEAPEVAVAEVEPRERPGQAGQRVLLHGVAPVAARRGEAHAVGEGGQAAQHEIGELRQ